MKKEKTFSAVMWSKRSKRYVSLTLVFSLLLGLLCMLVPAAAAAETADGLVYEEANEEITITGYTGAGGEVVIPAEISNKPVTKIGINAFLPTKFPAANLITKIVIPESVAVLDAYFDGCSALKTVIFPENLSIPITASLFRNCTALQSVTLPITLTEIGNSMFQGCSALTEIFFAQNQNNKNLTKIGKQAFQNCTALKTTHFLEGSSLVSIGANAFESTGICEFIAPKSLEIIDHNVFLGCTDLTDITLYEKVSSIANTAFNNIPKEQLTIHGIAGSYAYTFAIENGYAFAAIQEGADLVTTYLQAKIDEAKGLDPALYTKESYAALQTAIAHAEQVLEEATEQTQIDAEIAALQGVIEALEPFAFRYQEIAEGTEIAITGFNNPGGAAEIPAAIDGKPVTSIGEGAFEDDLITSVSIPAGVKTIGNAAFRRCSQLQTVTFAEGSALASIGDNAFEGCQKLSSLQLPEGVTEIGRAAFNGCRALKEITIPNGVTELKTLTFGTCTSLQNIILPEGLQTIGDKVFSGCAALTQIVLPDGVTALGTRVFNNCQALAKVLVPASVESIAEDAFNLCESVTLYGYADTAAETFAQANEIAFVVVAESKEALAGKIDEAAAIGPDGITEDSYAALQQAIADAQAVLADPFADQAAVDEQVGLLKGAIGSLEDDITDPTQPTGPTSPTEPPVAITYILGDTNEDGAVDLKDVLMIQNYQARVLTLTGSQFLAADVNADGLVNVDDALNIQKYLSKMETEYAIGQEQTATEEPSVPTDPPTQPTAPTGEESTEPSQGEEGSLTLYVKNGVGWLTNDGCKLFVYNTDTQESIQLEQNETGSYFLTTIDESWQNLAFYRLDPLDPGDDVVGTAINKWEGLPARESNDCFNVTADGSGTWTMYDPNEETGARTIYFDNSVTQWEQVYIYGWSFGLYQEFVPMEQVTDTVYKYTFTEGTSDGAQGFLFVEGDTWTTNDKQTADVATEAGKNYYTGLQQGGDGKWSGTWDVYTEA